MNPRLSEQAPPLIDIARRLGLQIDDRGQAFGPCPSCGRARRERSRRRLPCGLRRDGLGWKCHRCGARGDAVNLASVVACGHLRPANSHEWRQVRSLLGIDRTGPAPRLRLRRSPPVPKPPRRPPIQELMNLWRASYRPDARELNGRHPAALSAMRFYAERDFHPMALAELGIVRELPLPEAHDFPRWWPARWARIWRVAILAFDPQGRPRSIHARACEKHAIKTRWPRGFEARGLLFADRKGLTLLQGRPAPELGAVIVVEGLTDLLRCALVTARRPEVAVLGAAAGGFKALAEVRWPNVEVFAATDAGKTGEGYALEIAKALAPRPVRRLNPERMTHGT